MRCHIRECRHLLILIHSTAGERLGLFDVQAGTFSTWRAGARVQIPDRDATKQAILGIFAANKRDVKSDCQVAFSGTLLSSQRLCQLKDFLLHFV